MKLRVLLATAIATSYSCLVRAEVEQTQLLFCEKPELAGLYRQCQDVTLIQDLGERARVYLNMEKRVVLVPRTNLYLGDRAKSFSDLRLAQKVAVPGDHLWNQDSEGYESICEISRLQHQTKLVNVDCGKHKSGWIDAGRLLRLRSL